MVQGLPVVFWMLSNDFLKLALMYSGNVVPGYRLGCSLYIV